MEDLDSVFIHQEGVHELRQKLVNATLELETMKNVKAQLFNLLKMAYQERDEARCQLHKLMNQFVPSSPTNLQNVFDTQNIVMFPSVNKANSSITESDNSLSHDSPQVDSFFDTVSSPPEFTNINAVDPINNMSYLNQNLVQDFNFSAPHTLIVPSVSDPATAVIDSLAKERSLPQKGKLLKAVIDAGPLLKTLFLAGPLPTWRNPPPFRNIKVPSLAIKKCDGTTNIGPNTLGEKENSLLKPKLPPLLSSNAPSTCSASMLTFAGQTTGSWNRAWQLNSTSGVNIQVPSCKRQRHQ